MSTCDEYIQKLKYTLPDLLTVNDLVELRIFPSKLAANIARKRQKPPEYFKLSNRAILYTKESVLKYLKDSKRDTIE